jgi:NAD(P)-dependent dehydrogenase (short-subunit alcohol dehydrogenase family)
MKYVLITGVSSGIGYDCAKEILRCGYHVLGSVRRKDDVAKLQNEFGAAFTPLIFDVCKIQEVNAAVPVVQSRVGRNGLYALINNAGIAVAGPLNSLPLDQMRYQFEVNVFGQLTVIQSFLPLLGAAKQSPLPPGRIINISSTSGGRTYPFMGSYSASKFALEAMSTALRRELMIYGIKVIVVRPASTWTDIWKKVPDVEEYHDNDYYPYLKKMRDYMTSASRDDMMPVTKVSRVLLRILNSKNPKTRYVVTQRRFRNWIITRMLPERTLDKIIASKLGFIIYR